MSLISNEQPFNELVHDRFNDAVIEDHQIVCIPVIMHLFKDICSKTAKVAFGGPLLRRETKHLGLPC